MNKHERLAQHFIPENYRLYLHPDKDELTFSGRVTISGAVSKSTNKIKLHAKNLKVSATTIKSSTSADKSVTAAPKSLDEVLVLDLSESVSGSVEITIEFSGDITKPMVGLYPCTFKQDGKDQVLLATQFESHHAREVFPCIDEPAAKATFDLELKTLANETVLANTEVIESRPADREWIITKFATTPKMSTYLLAFVTGPLESKEHIHGNGTITRVWSIPAHIEDLDFALDVAVRSLEFFNSYFGIDYPLTKCDHVALPDFAAGAMENWGLITYRESLLIVDKANTSLSNRQSVALVIAHELAHQWFGNLVTMEWWTDLWLNEGFATWIEYLAVDELFPDWRIWDQFVSDEYLPGMALDSLKSSHPIEVEIEEPEDIRSIFDAISYNKGASVIRMLHAFLGADQFRDGLRHYLANHTFENASTNDLWQALEESSDQPVRAFMAAWTTQSGYPVVKINTDNPDRSVTVSQRPFELIQSMLKKDESSNTLWPIPLDLALHSDSMLLKKPNAKWKLSHLSDLKLNRSQTGWYITEYDSDQRTNLRELIETKRLAPLDRIGPIYDSFQLAKAGDISTVEAMELVSSYSAEDNVVVWDVLLGQLLSIKSVFDDEQFLNTFRPFISNLLQSQYWRLGWDEKADESHFDKLLRPTILGQASANQLEPAVKEALNRFNQAERPQDIAPDIRGLVCATACREIGDRAYDKLLTWYKSSTSSQIKSQLSVGLCSARDPVLIKNNLSLIKSDDVKLQEVAQWVSYLFYNHKSKHEAWRWLQSNWDWITANFGSDIMTISYFPKIVGNAFSDPKLIEEYESFFNRVETAGINLPVSQGLESLQWRANWRHRDFEKLKKFINQQRNTPK